MVVTLTKPQPFPAQFFNVYADIARVVGALFLLLVVVILIDFAYTLQEWIEDKASAYEDSLRDEVQQQQFTTASFVRLSLTLLLRTTFSMKRLAFARTGGASCTWCVWVSCCWAASSPLSSCKLLNEGWGQRHVHRTTRPSPHTLTHPLTPPRVLL